MKRLLNRALLVAVSFPLFFVLIVLLPHYRHLAFNVVVVSASCVGAFEVEALFRRKKVPTARYLAPILGGSIPCVTYLQINGLLWGDATFLWIVGVFGAILLRGCFVRTRRDLAPALLLVSSSTFVVLYPGLFMSYLVRIAGLRDASFMLLMFLSLVFANDMLSYSSGSLAGRALRLGIPASPRKTIVGFVVGFIGSVGVALLFYVTVPRLFGNGLPAAVGVGGLIGICVIVGDLVESALKRSAVVKDSGTIIPGRGGLLDSIDSMLVSAPVFYYLFERIVV